VTREAIYDLSPKNAPHSNIMSKLTEVLVPALLGSQFHARFEQPIVVSGWTGPNAPEIDVAVIAQKAYLLLKTSNPDVWPCCRTCEQPMQFQGQIGVDATAEQSAGLMLAN
jgi:hypothetical protein